MRPFTIILILLFPALLFARPTYRGYSSAPGTTGTCASSCHGQGAGTVEITGFPESYIPDSTYLITITAVSGSSISNFNGSVRVGTGSTNAGTISSGTNTATYNVTGETNGIHLSANNRTSGTFNWHAPAAGTGNVRLYSASFQGSNMNTGRTTVIQLTATEAVIETPPGQASNPTPANLSDSVSVTLASLSWAAADRADSYSVYFGTTEPLELLGNVTNTTITLTDSLDYLTNYLWRVDAVNNFGTTAGVLWQFTTITNLPPLPGLATNPYPHNNATGVSIHVDTLSWSPASHAETYHIYMGAAEPLEPLITISDTLILVDANLPYNTTFMWRVDAENIAGTTTGTTWSFTTEVQSAAHDEIIPQEFAVSAAYPNPFNSSIRVTLAVPQSSIVTARIFDTLGREVATLYNGNLSAGSHDLLWNAAAQSAGTYFLRVSNNGNTQTQKLIYLP